MTSINLFIQEQSIEIKIDIFLYIFYDCRNLKFKFKDENLPLLMRRLLFLSCQ